MKQSSVAVDKTSTVMQQTFDQARVRRAFDRAANRYSQHAVLQNEVCHRLLEKLDVVKINPDYILDAGAGTGAALPDLFERYKKAQLIALDLSENMLAQSAQHGSLLRSPHLVCADIESLPFADNTFDLVFSSLSMQWCNDLNAAFLEARRVLKPGGLFVFATFGPDTLKELRASWASVDKANHVNQFIDMHDIGDALLHDRFAEPVMEAEVITVTYDTVDEIMHDLKAIGANVTAKKLHNNVAGLSGKTVLKRVRQSYEQFRKNDVLPVSYEIIYGHAWKPTLEQDGNRDSNHQFVNFSR
ncbi:Malonyl-[acyl-carrier protein] O-methyltransferase [hydrothermal vent metagenome]|uniref:malonyl-[acyl-carrier protein] O-methyltransferase n=1 Tax=hydrothermal vent metagenome TaxID=652676 RepID=A0A3B0WHU3_9ZZZZ